MMRKYGRSPLLIERRGVSFWHFSDGTEMPYIGGGDTIDRSGASALMPEDVASDIIKNVPQRSSIMQLGRKLPNMARAQQRMPVLAGLISGGFVTGEPTQADNTLGRKPTSRLLWANKYLNAEEIAVIVPIPENVLDDADYDIWGEVRPQIEEEFGRIFDAAVLFGTNKPSTWPDGIIDGATAAGNLVTTGSVTPENPDLSPGLYSDIFEVGGVENLVEEDGFDTTGFVAARRIRAKLRGLRDNTGNPMYMTNPQDRTRYALDGQDIFFPKTGLFDPNVALLIGGDFDQLVWTFRQDLTYQIFTEGVITDADGNIEFNLMQQDMIALRAKMRLAWQIPNPINRENVDNDTRYPFAALVPAGS